MKSRWYWALVAAIVLVIVVGAVLSKDRCYVREHVVIVMVIALAWMVAFIFAGNIIRVLLLVFALGLGLLYPHPEFTPSVEVGAILTMRQAAVLLQNYKQNHSAEGYPETSPAVVPNCRVRGLYEFRYSRERSSASVTADRFTLVAVPILHPDLRGLRSFALTEDGHLYATKENEGRPANRGDQVLE